MNTDNKKIEFSETNTIDFVLLEKKMREKFENFSLKCSEIHRLNLKACIKTVKSIDAKFFIDGFKQGLDLLFCSNCHDVIFNKDDSCQYQIKYESGKIKNKSDVLIILKNDLINYKK